MSEKLILRLSSQNNSSIPWLVWSETNNEVIVSGELSSHQELSSLTSYAHGRQLTVLLNSADVRLFHHEMATKPSRQLLNALPYMLEDELAEDIDKLHFLIEKNGFNKETEKYWVNIAIVRKSLMHYWLSLLTEAGLNPKVMLPDVLCLPFPAASQGQIISALQLGQQWLVRDGMWSGSCIDKGWLSLYCQQKLAHTEPASEADKENEAISFQHYSELPDDLVANLMTNPYLSFDAKELELPMLLLAREAQNIKWNMLQGDLAPKKSVSKTWLTWRPAVALLACVLVIKFVSVLLLWQQKNQELALAKEQLAQMYQQAFPKEKLRIGLVRRQLNRKVQEVSSGQGNSEVSFLALMNKMTPVLSRFSDVKADSYRYDGKRAELRINASAPSFQKFEQFKNSLQQLGLEVTQGAVNNEGQMVTGSLNIKEAS